MDVFRVRDRLIEDYREFTGSFVDSHDKTIREHVDERMARGYQWPDPWLSLNPDFASGGTITELRAEELLQPECERIFRLKNNGHAGEVLRLHQHQREAIEAAHAGHNYVLTTGTGSGKSLTYIIPIVDRILAAKAAGRYRPGIKAIVVYPMNALANSRLGELRKFLTIGYPDGPPVSFDRYTGQESPNLQQATYGLSSMRIDARRLTVPLLLLAEQRRYAAAFRRLEDFNAAATELSRAARDLTQLLGGASPRVC